MNDNQYEKELKREEGKSVKICLLYSKQQNSVEAIKITKHFVFSILD